MRKKEYAWHEEIKVYHKDDKPREEIVTYETVELPCCKDCYEKRVWLENAVIVDEHENEKGKPIITKQLRCDYLNICSRVYDMYNKEKL